MKIAFSAKGTTPESPLDARFGRTARFLVFDPEMETWGTVENTQNLNAAQGAGIQSAQNVIRSGAKAVVTGGHCGPKAFDVLRAADIEVFASDAPSVAEALRLFQTGKLERIDAADVEGHWA
jgi:predicted Fe-Mo cluster-binding NifX family protein